MNEPGKLVATLSLPFEVLRTLYEGTSEVRLYENEVTGVKQIGKRVSAIGAEKATVFREPTVLQKLSHDNIVPVYTVAKVDDPDSSELITVIEMVMPFYPRGSAYDALQRGERFSVGDAVRLTREGLLGLCELHEAQRLLHRDVKSANLFIDDRGHLRVGDLGLAVPMESDGTAEAHQAASQIYSAPELLTAKRVDRRTDIFGFGLTLLELLNGPFPYEQYTRDDVFKRLTRGRRPIKDAHLIPGPHISPPLRRVINKAISLDPADRYASALEMIAALDHAAYVDWKPPEKADDLLRWEGQLPTNRQVRYEVAATRSQRRQEWTLSARRYISRYQRFGIEDQTVTALSDRVLTAFFDQVFKHATSL